MNGKRLHLILLLGGILWQYAGIGAERPASPGNGTSSEVKLDKELNIYRSTLLEGKSEQIRIDAATVMLFNENPLYRQILLDTLGQADNRAARLAVCKALSQTRASGKRVPNEEDFVQPLLAILTTDDTSTVRLAAEATLIFDYDDIQEDVEQILTDGSVQARLNAISTLKLHPDVRAAIRLIELIDDPDGQVATAAGEALVSLGIPVGKDAKTRKQDINRLRREGPVAFLRRRLIRLETEMRDQEMEADLWRDRYLSELSKRYDAIADETAKAKFLAEHLGSSEPIVKLWALEKVRQDRVGTATKSKLPAELGPILINLIADPDRDVRLRTAKLLSLMGELNSAERLLEQLGNEQDDEVKTEIFVALGVAVSSASLSPIKIAPETRRQTLEWAAKYLSQPEPEKARKGADLIRKLLEQDGLPSGEVDRYLHLLADRYRQQKNSKDGTLRGELLSVMAGLCAQTSSCRAHAAKTFQPLFDDALNDETNLVRQAAVDGLIYIDKPSALAKLRKALVNDPSSTIRLTLMDLRGEVGGEEDLPWLAERMGTTGEGQAAWQAMLKIFKRSRVGVLTEWITKLDSDTGQNKLSAEQRISFLEVAEQKAAAENEPATLKNVRAKLAPLYRENNQFEQAAKALEFLCEAAQTAEEKEAVLPELLDAYLRWPNVERAAKLVENCVREKDLDPNNMVVRVIDNYLGNPLPGSETAAVIQALSEVKIENPDSRPMWQEQLKRWAERVGKAVGPDKSKEGSTSS
jgi:HEAT repeat protein